MGLFGGGNSSTQTTNQTFDKRVVADGGSVGVSGDNTIVNSLDQGAIANALDLARAAIDANSNGVIQVLGLAKQSVTGSVETLAKSTTDTIASLNTGYSNAKGLDAGRTLMIVAGLLVVGFYFLKKG